MTVWVRYREDERPGPAAPSERARLVCAFPGCGRDSSEAVMQDGMLVCKCGFQRWHVIAVKGAA